MSYELLQQASELYSATPDLTGEIVGYFASAGLILIGVGMTFLGIDSLRRSSEKGELEEDLTQPQ